MSRKSAQQAPWWFLLLTGIVVPGVLLCIGLHDVITGRSFMNFGSAQFRDNVVSYSLQGLTARVSGLAMMGLGTGLFLRWVHSRQWFDRLPFKVVANVFIIASVAIFFTAHWVMPGVIPN